MKGISLPINVLVIVAIAIVVLLGLVAMYFTGFGPFTTAAGLEGIKNEACRVLVQEKRCKVYTYEITISNFDANKNGNNDPGASWDWTAGTGDDNLAALCYNYYGIRGEASCKQLCQCAGMGKYVISPQDLYAMGDVSWDCVIDHEDEKIIKDSFGTDSSDPLCGPNPPPCWNPIADFNGDGSVDGREFSVWGLNFGKTCTYS